VLCPRVAVVRIVRAAADPLECARALGSRPGLAVLASRPQGAPRPDDARWSFVACDPVEASESLVPPGGDDAAGGPAPRWIGVVPYEALRGIERPAWTRSPDDRPACVLERPAWRRYAAVVRIDHVAGEVAVVGDDERSVDALARALASGSPGTAAGRPAPGAEAERAARLRPLPADEPDVAHVARVEEALRLIAAGDLYEVNLARRIPLSVHGDALAIFASLLGAAPAPWSFLQVLADNPAPRVVCGTSPELALSVRGDVLRTCPIKGTRPRGRDAADDARLAGALDADPKERAELTMAVDVHRSDLGRVAVPGSVRVLGEPRVLAGRTVWSRVAEIVARRAPGVSLEDVARAVLPCGSITGAPKVRAMEVIARLEPWRRGAYTGAFGWVGRDGRLELAMAIRTLEWEGQAGQYFAGGGIVADSDPARELEETRWKASQLGEIH